MSGQKPGEAEEMKKALLCDTLRLAAMPQKTLTVRLPSGEYRPK